MSTRNKITQTLICGCIIHKDDFMMLSKKWYKSVLFIPECPICCAFFTPETTLEYSEKKMDVYLRLTLFSKMYEDILNRLSEEEKLFRYNKSKDLICFRQWNESYINWIMDWIWYPTNSYAITRKKIDQRFQKVNEYIYQGNMSK